MLLPGRRSRAKSRSRCIDVVKEDMKLVGVRERTQKIGLDGDGLFLLGTLERNSRGEKKKKIL